ncbi:MAG TPA: hypothetical protein VGL94_22750 [Ktedonobacteraceae bacterium]|jgi:hypothetical protein
MSKKPDLSKAFGERFKTEEKVDVQDPLAAAAASLSKDVDLKENEQEGVDARMQARIKDNIQVSTPEDRHDNIPANSPERKQTRKPTSVPARKQEYTETSEEASVGKGVKIDMLYDQIQQKKHLSNGSFRYRANELEKLDAIFKELEEKKPGRISKNDIARMALIAFYEDFEKNGDESVLAQVFKRM